MFILPRLSRLFRSRPPIINPQLILYKPIAVIGDIHGCDQLLMQLLGKLATEAPTATIICVGDYIDRGPNSAAVMPEREP
jgi:serine/threonine protein phosphatase 1